MANLTTQPTNQNKEAIKAQLYKEATNLLEATKKCMSDEVFNLIQKIEDNRTNKYIASMPTFNELGLIKTIATQHSLIGKGLVTDPTLVASTAIRSLRLLDFINDVA